MIGVGLPTPLGRFVECAIRLSVILITKNEASNVDACLASVAFADETIVLDGASSDDTAERARRRGATVVVRGDWPGFGAQKQRALDLAAGDWVLSIDADERVTPALAEAIRRVVADAASGRPVADAYALSRRSRFCGQWMRHGDWYPDRVVRLFRRGRARFSDDTVHERLVVDGRVASLAGELLHETMPTLDDAIDKMNRYSAGRAADMARAGRRGGLARALGHGAWAFVRGYVVKGGFLDGRLGLVLAASIAEGTYYRYLKLGLLAGRKTTGRAAEPLH